MRNTKFCIVSLQHITSHERNINQDWRRKKRRRKWWKKYSFHGCDVLSGWKRRLLRGSLQRGVTEGGQSETFIASFEKPSDGRPCGRFRRACPTMFPNYSPRRIFPSNALQGGEASLDRWNLVTRYSPTFWQTGGTPNDRTFCPVQMSRPSFLVPSVKRTDSLTAACSEHAHVAHLAVVQQWIHAYLFFVRKKTAIYVHSHAYSKQCLRPPWSLSFFLFFSPLRTLYIRTYIESNNSNRKREREEIQSSGSGSNGGREIRGR